MAENTQPIRCFTRALKNARFLRLWDPKSFDRGDEAKGFGTGIPMDLLRQLHRTPHHSPLVASQRNIADFLRDTPFPKTRAATRDPLFSGTIHFAQITFQTSGGNVVVPTADMNQIVAYAQHSIKPIGKYAAQYGPNNVAISPALLTKSVTLSSAVFSDADVQKWVDEIVADAGLPSDSCIFIVVPRGITGDNIGANAGYHSKATVPYIIAGVFATGLTLADEADVYGMVVSHEIAEMIVDPLAGGGDPEVCDPCDLNCTNLTRCYFDASDAFVGSNQQSPPGGFPFTYYVCAVVKPAGATDCPASSTNCAYAP